MNSPVLSIVLKELIDYKIYLTALFIGAVINWTTMDNPFYSWIPYAVPVVVQVFSRSVMKIQFQSKEHLLLLPAMRKDPAFVMNRLGIIEFSQGKTQQLLEQYKIKCIDDFSHTPLLERILEKLSSRTDQTLEFYFNKGKCWYEIHAMENPINRELILLWFTDITATKELMDHLREIQEFSQKFQIDIDQTLEDQDPWIKMARLILSNQYSSVFIAKLEDTYYSGHVYKQQEDRIVRSPSIMIEEDSQVPLLASRKEKQVVSGVLDDFNSIEDFHNSFPFAPEVQSFIGEPITGFINYHSQELSIIAFNHRGPMGPQDEIAMEIEVNTAWTISNLMDLARENKDRFTQSIEGLCAASEFSDEITGKHIYRVNEYSAFIAEKIGLSQKAISSLAQVAAIHDIGKVAVPHLVKLTTPFTQEERLQMQMHTVYGSQILKKMQDYGKEDENLQLAWTIALCHHQQWNGRGYPGIKGEDGSWNDLSSREPQRYSSLKPLKGEEIPLEALIVSLADRYDALRSERQYKKGYSHEETLEILKMDDRTGESGMDIFGPKIYEILLKYHRSLDEIFRSMQD